MSTTKRSKRHAEILQRLRVNGYTSVETIASELGVSDMTVRRDLALLQELGLISRHHGGATPVSDAGKIEMPYQLRITENIEKKRRIGKTAAALVQDSDVVIIDAGTTSLEVARNLSQNRLTVITNGTEILDCLAERSDIGLISTGGLLRWESQCYVGPLTLRAIKSVNANIAFITITGLSVTKGLTTRDMDIAEIKRAIMGAAEKIVLVMDSTKMHKHTLTTVATLDEIDALVTDNELSPEDRKRLEVEGVQVIVADE